MPIPEECKATGKLKFDQKEDVWDHQGRVTIPVSLGYLLHMYWKLLEKELRPKSNNILSIMELWTDCKQGNIPLSEWITKVYNLVELCEYKEFKDRVIRDVLIISCNSTAWDKIVWKGSKITLDQVIDLQIESQRPYRLTTVIPLLLKICINWIMMQRRRSNPSHSSIQKVIHSQSHAHEDMRKYAKLWRQSAAVARKLVSMRNTAGKQVTILRSKYTLPVPIPLQLLTRAPPAPSTPAQVPQEY